MIALEKPPMLDQNYLTAVFTGAPRRIHLLGVAGSGMSGIAGLLLALGHRVSGCDRATTLEVQRLIGLGLQFYPQQTAHSVQGAEFVVYSSAIKPGNPAYDEAIRLCLPLIRRAEALSAILYAKKGIVVAGMHGKTTTSSMAAHVLRVGGLHPSHYVGAEIPILGTNAHWDSKGDYFVAEGDESDGTLVNYQPEHAIILNIEEEHLDFYKDLAQIEAVFEKLLRQTQGAVIYCADDANTVRLCGARHGAISYGQNGSSFYRYRILETGNFQTTFEVERAGKKIGEFVLNIPGVHNVSNAAGVIALAHTLGIDAGKIREGLESFRGAKRRFEVKYTGRGVRVVDDYGHHPTEIKATLATARSGGAKRLVVMFQPHRYTRTQALKEQFGEALGAADLVYVTDVYPASEKPIPGVTGQTIVDAAKARGMVHIHYRPKTKDLWKRIAASLKPGDLVLSLGAGDIHEQSTALVAQLERATAIEAITGEGTVRLFEPMSWHTTLRVGGPAEFWVEPKTEAAFAALVNYAAVEELPFMVVGRGSNLLVQDGGIPGIVAHISEGEFARLEVDGLEIRAGAGVKLKQVAAVARNAGIGGFEWMDGIPGDVGGSLRMNAGAMGGDMFSRVVRFRYVDRTGGSHEAGPMDIDVRYRSVPMLALNYAMSAVFRGEPGDPTTIDRLRQESLDKRKTTQPVAASAGCIFKNPVECPAGKLVQELGLKNLAVGKARVSEVHGNFIVNDGGATGADVLALIRRIQEIAKNQRGIRLDTEVQIVGEPVATF
ncbi:MAG TPA: UDP-N-acetylmuramate--L-alanine ligase [Chthoniobacterales bacterium]